MLQADVSVDGDLACRIYDSCESVAVVGETTAMQSGLVRAGRLEDRGIVTQRLITLYLVHDWSPLCTTFPAVRTRDACSPARVERQGGVSKVMHPDLPHLVIV